MKRTPLVFLLLAASLSGLLGGMLATGIAQASRNSGGVYSLPAGNPVVAGTAISPTVHNATMSDIGTELTNSLDRGGRSAMTAALPLAAGGSASAPMLTFTGDTNTGCWRVGADDMACGAGGTKAIEWTGSVVAHPVAATFAAGITSTIASGSNAFGAATNGSRVDFGAGASDYASSDGTNVTFAGPVTFAGGINVGSSGSLLSACYAGSANLDFPNIAGAACADLTITVTGATAGSICMLGQPATLAVGMHAVCKISAADTAVVRMCNDSGGANDMGSLAFKVLSCPT